MTKLSNTLEISAKNKENAIDIFRKSKNFNEDYKYDIEEIKEPKNFLGIFKKEGLYKINYEKDNKKRVENRINKFIELMDLDINYKITKKDDNSFYINFDGTDNGILIGKKGKNLNSFEHLINTMMYDLKIFIDVEEFKKKREETLKDLANKMAKKVINTGKSVRLNPMPSKERRIIHEVLNTYSKIITHSEGKDPKRYIVIKLRRKK